MDEISSNIVQLSVIIPVTNRYDPIPELFYKYKKSIDSLNLSYEIIYAIDGNQPEVINELAKLQDSEKITVITLSKWFGETTALNAAFSASSGEILLTLPAYEQINTTEIPKLIQNLAGNDMVLARRWPRLDSFINRIQTKTFNFLLGFSSKLKINDAGCSARAFKRQVIEEVDIYGDLHRFLPVMAFRQGFKVIEVDISQSKKDAHSRVYSPGIYIRRLLDLLTIFFLLKFTKKPLRFFGLVGSTLFGIGALITLYLISERIFFDVSLGDRPALVLSSLMIILGIQIIAIGLIGEIIIFTHAKDLKEYKIDKIINSADQQ